MSLPSEAQWEYGARGGTSTVWWTGQERESLRGKVNIADQTAKRRGASWVDIDDWPDFEDGSVVHAEIASFPANGFGLHEVAGNLWEWCLDGYDQAFYRARSAGTPLLSWSGSASRVFRGGGFSFSASADALGAPPRSRAGLPGLRRRAPSRQGHHPLGP